MGDVTAYVLKEGMGDQIKGWKGSMVMKSNEKHDQEIKVVFEILKKLHSVQCFI